MGYLNFIRKLPIDLGQGHFRHTTKAKKVAYGLVGRGHGQRALDVGCGDGFWSERLREKGWKVTSIDHGDSRYHAVNDVDVENKLPYADNTFGLVWASEVLEHIVNVEVLCKEINRTLCPGGQLIATVPNSNFMLFRFFKLFGILPYQLQNPDHKHFFSYQDIKNILPNSKISGFFPYYLLKFTIVHGVDLLSPTLIISYQKR